MSRLRRKSSVERVGFPKIVSPYRIGDFAPLSKTELRGEVVVDDQMDARRRMVVAVRHQFE